MHSLDTIKRLNAEIVAQGGTWTDLEDAHILDLTRDALSAFHPAVLIDVSFGFLLGKGLDIQRAGQLSKKV
jgi:hypothetical protein